MSTITKLPNDPGWLVRIGGKARSLAQLEAAGFPVPDWFAVPPETGETEVLAATCTLGENGRLLAVRSSAVDEDGLEHSYAGQLESYLNVSVDEVWERVVAVRRSGATERVITYRRERNLPLPPPVPAVLVQQMVEPDAAGVCFTADPVSGRRSVAVVVAVAGLGDKLVDGETAGETFHVDRDGKIVLRESSVGAVLGAEQAVLVASLARKAERFFGRPQDMEWAIARGELYLLQSRPITTLAEKPDPDGLRQLWDNSNIAESYGGITLPLTFSFARGAYEEVYRQFCSVMQVPARLIEEHSNVFRHMLGLLRGRVYYNLLNWYRVLALLPGFRLNRRFMEQMMGVKEGLPEQVAAEIANTGRSARLADAIRLGRTVFGLLRAYLRLDRDVRSFYARLDDALGTGRPDLSLRRPDELAAYYRSLESKLLRRWDAPIVNDFIAMIFHGVLRQLGSKWCGDAAGALCNSLLAGQGGMVSAEPVALMRRLADMIRSDADLVRAFELGTWPEAETAMRDRPAVARAVGEYLSRFGDRCMEELKLESWTLHDNPLPLLRSVAALARREPCEHGDSSRILREAESSVASQLSRRPIRRIVYFWVLRRARNLVKNRENLRFERTRLFGRVRMIFVELGRRLHEFGNLRDPRDVFYLEVEEALGFVEGTATCGDLAGIAAVRKAEYERHRATSPPPGRCETRGIPQLGQYEVQGAVRCDVDGDTRRGTGASPGIVRGRVRVVREPRGGQLQRGEILVAEQTDPGWVILFPLAAGLLVERGSLLSHSAIVARELGLPAVVSLNGLSEWLRDGDFVEMDGSTGQVRRTVADDDRPPVID